MRYSYLLFMWNSSSLFVMGAGTPFLCHNKVSNVNVYDNIICTTDHTPGERRGHSPGSAIA
jgi:hypothetical protein